MRLVARSAPGPLRSHTDEFGSRFNSSHLRPTLRGDLLTVPSAAMGLLALAHKMLKGKGSGFPSCDTASRRLCHTVGKAADFPTSRMESSLPRIEGEGMAVDHTFPLVIPLLNVLAVGLHAIANGENPLADRLSGEGRRLIGGRAKGIEEGRNRGVTSAWMRSGALQMPGEQDHGGIEIMVSWPSSHRSRRWNLRYKLGGKDRFFRSVPVAGGRFRE